MSDFFPDFKNKDTFLNCQPAFQLVDGDVFSIDNMDEKELRESIVDDILAVTMWEKDYKDTLSFTITTLLRFIPTHKQLRVMKAFYHEEIHGLFSIIENEIRIRDDRAIIQAAVDYVGVYYSGYGPSDKNEKVLSVNRDIVEKLYNDDFAIENLLMDLQATVVVGKMIN